MNFPPRSISKLIWLGCMPSNPCTLDIIGSFVEANTLSASYLTFRAAASEMCLSNHEDVTFECSTEMRDESCALSRIRRARSTQVRRCTRTAIAQRPGAGAGARLCAESSRSVDPQRPAGHQAAAHQWQRRGRRSRAGGRIHNRCEGGAAGTARAHDLLQSL